MASRNVARSGDHFQVHLGLKDMLSSKGADPRRVDDDTPEARELRSQISQYYQKHDGENKDFGIELGYRYKSSIVLPDDGEGKEPEWKPSEYTPTSWPGGRPPHVCLRNGSAIFDSFGPDWTLLVFSEAECGQEILVRTANDLSIPMKTVNLSKEVLAKTLYERNLVLIRPDQHVAWRAASLSDDADARKILMAVTGRVSGPDGHLANGQW